MILVTVGAQMPFDRLIKIVDDWACENDRDDVFAQIGPTRFRPRQVSFTRFMDSQEFEAKVASARVVVAHAGMGTIITALRLAKPLLVVPRRDDLMETRNDHQLATARRFQELGKVVAAFDEGELRQHLDHLDELEPPPKIGRFASPGLLDALRTFIEQIR